MYIRSIGTEQSFSSMVTKLKSFHFVMFIIILLSFQVLQKAVYRAVGGTLLRHPAMARLHCYPDSVISFCLQPIVLIWACLYAWFCFIFNLNSLQDVPPEILKNVNAQMKQLRPIPKRLTEYSKEDVSEFPKVFDWY